MNQQTGTPSMPPAARVQVLTPSGLTVPGWLVRTDTVVAEAGGLGPEVTVVLGDRKVDVEETWEATLEITTNQPWTALVLPEGTHTMAGEAMPPQLPLRPDDREARDGVRGGIWCVLFPRMRGCRR